MNGLIDRLDYIRKHTSTKDDITVTITRKELSNIICGLKMWNIVDDVLDAELQLPKVVRR